jgi:hypothetical protein
MFPKNYLRAEAINLYKDALSQGDLPTALAVSVLDVKQPSFWDGNPDVNEHWCLSHYLLDGHHKMYAASELGVPVSILSFLAYRRASPQKNRWLKPLKRLQMRSYLLSRRFRSFVLKYECSCARTQTRPDDGYGHGR